MTIYRYQSAAEVRKTIKLSWDETYPDLPCTFKVRRVDFSDLARSSSFFVTLEFPKEGTTLVDGSAHWEPILTPEFKARIYVMVQAQFPKGSGVIID